MTQGNRIVKNAKRLHHGFGQRTAINELHRHHPGEVAHLLPGQGVLRVVAIGDSNTLGWAGAEGSNWPAALGRAMTGARLEAEVVNGGVWGYSSFQGVRRMRETLGYRPDVVLVSYGSNDAHRVHRPDREFAGKSGWFRAFERRFNHYRLGQLMTAATHRLKSGLARRQCRAVRGWP